MHKTPINDHKISILSYLSEAFLNVPRGCRPQSQVLSPGSAPSPSHTGWLRSCRICQSQHSSDWTRSLSTLATQPHGFLSTVWDLKDQTANGDCHIHCLHTAFIQLVKVTWNVFRLRCIRYTYTFIQTFVSTCDCSTFCIMLWSHCEKNSDFWSCHQISHRSVVNISTHNKSINNKGRRRWM